MAIINCPECGREVSDTAIACPNCGFAIREHFEEIEQKELEEENKKKQQREMDKAIKQIPLPKQPTFPIFMYFYTGICVVFLIPAIGTGLPSFIFVTSVIILICLVLPWYGAYSKYNEELKDYNAILKNPYEYKKKIYQERVEEKKRLERELARLSEHAVKCPYCGSIDTTKTSAILGFSHKQFSKQWKCGQCGSYF